MSWINGGLSFIPANWELKKARARTLSREGEFKESLKILEELTNENQNESGLWMEIALVQHHMENWDKALSALHKALEIDPNNPRAYCNILSIYRTTGQWEKARHILSNINNVLRESLPILSAEADLLLAQRKFTEAEEIFAKLCEEITSHTSLVKSSSKPSRAQTTSKSV